MAAQGVGTLASREWRMSDALVLSSLNSLLYLVALWSAGWERPNWGTYLCGIGALIAMVPVVREMLAARTRTVALIGAIGNLIVLYHAFWLPCTGACK